MNSKLKLTIQLMVQKSELKNILEILSSLSHAHFTNEVLAHLIREQLVITLPTVSKYDAKSFRKFLNLFFQLREAYLKKIMFLL